MCAVLVVSSQRPLQCKGNKGLRTVCHSLLSLLCHHFVNIDFVQQRSRTMINRTTHDPYSEYNRAASSSFPPRL